MNDRICKRLAWLVLLLLIIWIIVEIKLAILPMLSHPFSASQSTQFTYIQFGVIFVFGGCLLVLTYRRNTPTTAHGSAHFATREELKSYGTLAVNARKELRHVNTALTAGHLPPSKMHLGLYQKKLIALDEQFQESYVLVLAPTGKGKTSRIIISALLREFGSRSLYR